MYPMEIVKEAMEYICNNIEKRLTCESVSKKFNYSSFHFHRIFKHITGISVTDYIRNRRLYFSSIKILESSNTILEICLSCGFENQQTFDRAFKKKYKLTPRDFRVRNEYPTMELTPNQIIDKYYRKFIQGGIHMLQPYIVEKDIIRVIGIRTIMFENSIIYKGTGTRDDFIGSLNRINSLELNFSIDFWHPNRKIDNKEGLRSMFHGVEVDSLINLPFNLESLMIPASRWAYIPLRRDDPNVLALAPDENKDNFGYVIGCTYGWLSHWIKENGYERQDYPYEIEIWGRLDKGYENEGGPEVTLAIAIK